jgi:hypothetical protein
MHEEGQRQYILNDHLMTRNDVIAIIHPIEIKSDYIFCFKNSVVTILANS